ncbi:hypothetical protein [Nonomuraea sp. NPDC049784]|uniref:hypothetical protein n=1 Tax=Nonomuraea sp. NPDC049784 TaxID=3154361 RepID=UPI00340C7C8E
MSPRHRGRAGRDRQAFRNLPNDDQELLSLVAWEGLEHKEIAKALGGCPATPYASGCTAPLDRPPLLCAAEHWSRLSPMFAT